MSNNDAVLEHIIGQLRAHFNTTRQPEVLIPTEQVIPSDYIIQGFTEARELAAAGKRRESADRIFDVYQTWVRRAWVTDAPLPEQSGCRKDDVQECDHTFHDDGRVFACTKCGMHPSDINYARRNEKAQECDHAFNVVNGNCTKCGTPYHSVCHQDKYK